MYLAQQTGPHSISTSLQKQSAITRHIIRTIIELAVLLPVIVITGLAVVPDALAQIGSAVFLTVAALNEYTSASLAEGDIGFAAVIVQRSGINGNEATQSIIRSIDDRPDCPIPLCHAQVLSGNP